jgi:hypothetical protein
VRAEAEPILPGTVPASRRTMPGLGDEPPDEPKPAEEAAPPVESRAPPTPP